MANNTTNRTPKSRGNGQGCAIKRGKTWTAIWTEEFYVDGGNLHQRRRWKGGFKTKTAALAFAANPVPIIEVPTLRDYWNGWSTSDLLDLSDSKQTAYKIAWKKLGSLAGKQMDSITINDLQLVIDQKAPTFYPAKDMKTVLSHLFTRAVAEGNARTNLAEFIRLPQLEEQELQPFTEIELHKFWNAFGKGDTFVGYVLLMIYTGMMPGELMLLKAEMIHWDTNEIIGCALKTKKRKTTPIVFPEIIAPVLELLIQNSKSRSGKVLGMNKDNFYKEYHAAMTRVGVRDLPPYSCRHTTATALALGNIAPSVIKEVMRHTKFSTTERYIHPDMQSSHDAVNAMGKGKVC